MAGSWTMMMHGKKIVMLLAVVAAVSCRRVDSQSVAKLKAAGKALASIDFVAQERATIRLNDRTVTFESEVCHRRDGGTRRHRLSGDAPRSRGKPRFGDGGMRFAELFPPPQHLRLLRRNYHLKPGGEDVVAGRGCERIALMARSQGRPSVEIWLDKETSLPLKWRDLSPQGEVTFERELLSLNLGQRGPDSLFGDRSAGDRARTITLAQASEMLPGFVAPAQLPSGFELTEVRSLPRSRWRKDGKDGKDGWKDDERKPDEAARDGDDACRQIRLDYTDGLAKLVIYEFASTEDDERCERGLVKRFGDFNVVSAPLGRVRVAVCSNLVEEELRAVLEGLRAAATQAP